MRELMKLELNEEVDGQYIYVNPAHVVAVEECEPNEHDLDSGNPDVCTVILAATITDEDGRPSPLTAEVKGSAADVAKLLGLA